MSVVTTMQIIAALKTRLEELVHPADPAAKLFETVAYYDSELIGKAMRDLTIVKQRVCFIVPEGDDYETVREGRSVIVYATAQFNLLVADRAWTKGGQDAVFGGPNNLGVVAMKDEVIRRLLETPTLGLVHVALAPTGGNFIEVKGPGAKDTEGRECYVSGWSTPAGDLRYGY